MLLNYRKKKKNSEVQMKKFRHYREGRIEEILEHRKGINGEGTW